MPNQRCIASTRTLTDIANAIRAQNGENRRYRPGEMADAIAALDGSGSGGMQYPYDTTKYGAMTVVPYTDMANAIRGQNGETREYRPSEMAGAILELEWRSYDAYAIAVKSQVTSGKYDLYFIRSYVAPKVGECWGEQSIAHVYSGFEDTEYTSNSQVPWYSLHDDIVSVYFEAAIKPISCAYWFYMFRNCTYFALGLLDTSRATSLAFMFYYCSNVTSINYMFYFCTKLTTLTMGNWDMTNLQVVAQAFRNMTSLVVLDLSGWTMPEWTSTMQYTFYNCSKLTTIYAGCDLSDTAVNSYCFSSCSKLVGGAGTVYDSANVTADMARVDGLGGKPGYFTAK